MKLTLKEVSKHLGVSTATVSNAFNRPDQLSAKLRERILEQCKVLGYHGPNLAARSLRKGESGVIGVMLADSLVYSFKDQMAHQLLQGISQVLAEHEKQLLLLFSGSDTAHQSSAESLPDGFIFYGAPQGQSFERILPRGKPIVTVDFAQEQVGSVNIDNHQAACDVARHALYEPALSVAIIGIRLLPSDRVCRLLPEDLNLNSPEISRQRLKGYLQAAEEAQCSVSASDIWHIPVNSDELAMVAAKEVLQRSPQPQVVLCMTDRIALAVLRLAKQQGIAVPQQLVVVGFDDLEAAASADVQLTTVSQQSEAKGRLAAQMLLEGRQEQLVLPTELKVRRTSRVK